MGNAFGHLPAREGEAPVEPIPLTGSAITGPSAAWNPPPALLAAGEERARTLRALRQRLEALEWWRGADRQPLSTGCPPLDRLLPGGGLRPGTLCEWVAEAPGSGAGALALRAAAQTQGPLVVVDRSGEFYPPGAAWLGVDLSRLIVVRPGTRVAADWALDQALRDSAVGAVWADVDRLDDVTFRRWQLAAERSGVLGMLVRPTRARREPSWADVRLSVAPRPGRGWNRRLRLELQRCRGGRSGAALELEIDDETGALRVAPPLAAPTLARRA